MPYTSSKYYSNNPFSKNKSIKLFLLKSTSSFLIYILNNKKFFYSHGCNLEKKEILCLTFSSLLIKNLKNSPIVGINNSYK